jgi:hypothetical protein
MGEALEDPVFGSLAGWAGGWDGAIEWRPGHRVGVTICCEDGQNIPAMLAVARRSLEWLRAHETEAWWLYDEAHLSPRARFNHQVLFDPSEPEVEADELTIELLPWR